MAILKVCGVEVPPKRYPGDTFRTPEVFFPFLAKTLKRDLIASSYNSLAEATIEVRINDLNKKLPDDQTCICLSLEKSDYIVEKAIVRVAQRIMDIVIISQSSKGKVLCEIINDEGVLASVSSTAAGDIVVN